jgi:hypothetical protein
MSTGSPPPARQTGYASRRVTQAPHWHGLVVWDLLFNNLTTGLYLAAATSELARPAALGPSARVAYPIALAFLLADLALLVLDLGDPLRFHHMLRVFKPGSPMSLGTWSLALYAMPLTVLVAIDWLPIGPIAPGWARTLVIVIGLAPALGSAIYKGVLFSTSSQPGWRDARWLGGYLANSAVVLGCAGMLAISTLIGQIPAATVLRPALGILLMLNLVPIGLLAAELRGTVADDRARAHLTNLVLVAGAAGLLVPAGLLRLGGGPVLVLGATAGILIGNFLIRWAIVQAPHHEE